MVEQTIAAEGVGLSYHPFLHDVILAEPQAFDFIELPLDLYVDPARAGLLDPSGARLQQIVAAKSCVWHGTALSLGSVEAIDDPRPDLALAERIRQLMVRAGTGQYSDTIGFRRLAGRDLGIPQNLPYSEAAARWVALRYAAARAVLGQPFLLQLGGSAVAAPRTGWDVAAFLERLSGLADIRLVLDTTDLARGAAAAGIEPAELVGRLPGERIATLVTAGETDADWALLALLAERTAARAIVIRRSRTLFPLEAILLAARRAGALLARPRRPVPAAAAPASVPDPVDFAALQTYQREFIDYCFDPTPDRLPTGLAEVSVPARAALAASVQSWQTWRERLGDTHKAQQIAQFLAADAMRPARRGA